jgi:hypothetical protein
MLEWCLRRALSSLRLLSLSNLRHLLPEGIARERFMEAYVVVFVSVLTVAANLATVGALWCGAIAAYRIFDIVSYRLWFLFVKSKTNPWRPERLRRSLILAALNVFELAMGFAVLYLVSGEVSGSAGMLADPRSAFYFSVVTMLTVGYGDFAPSGGHAQLLVCCELFSGLIMLAFVLPALVSVFVTDPKTGSDLNNRGLDA